MTSRSRVYLLSLFCCRLIIIILNPNPSPSLSTFSSYNTGKKQDKKEKKKKQKKGKTVEVKRVAEEWEIWDEEEAVVKSEEEAKKMVPEKFHQWIKVFGKKQSERMPTRKVQDHVIEVKEGFVLRKRKVYLLSREEREEMREFIKEQLWKGYIQLSKSLQTALVFFVGKKDGKKWMVQDYRYLNE